MTPSLSYSLNGFHGPFRGLRSEDGVGLGTAVDTGVEYVRINDNDRTGTVSRRRKLQGSRALRER